ncbi:NAD(P)/FAD-dependent oxidoreductase [Paractinoplanes brasiliensis]|uniref:NADH dehydrogenase FAD-containing subunit n=1 Tax=Paractinoplanes brasiliensis TaxID=52695 RepID=A0A4V3C7F2_9ACTN|nr:FAD-dependent oxidoreductase [Actinoplanes brasiliensis]TDO37468.1 NADH dehydrogenase FAD-containing subunit [Actinoplanes brasiliensis]GID29213.1 oxidoreductase [Actinoplanes brasiliensis]
MTDIVVLGAGYAGLAAATNLAGRTRHRGDLHITLVNASYRFTERLRLHSTAAGHSTADFDLREVAAKAGVTFVQGWVTAAGTVRVDDDRTLSFDTLIWALGSTADTSDVPGAAENAYTLDSFADAEALAARLREMRTGAVLVCGTGLTGVETAAEIAERYPDLTVTLRGREEPGATLTPKARSYLMAVLTRLRVRVESGAEISKLLPGTADVVVWTAGTRVSPLAAEAGMTVDERGRIVTRPSLRSVSHPHVYAVGDAAAVRQRYGIMHGTCQSGMPTGVHAAVSIARELAGREPRPFRFGYYHAPISLGRRDAVVQFTRPDDSPRRAFLTGRAAVWYKETVTASPWPTFTRMVEHPGSASWWPRGGRFTR